MQGIVDLFDYDYQPIFGGEVLGRDDTEVTWVMGNYPPGYDPSAFFRIGPIVSANNQRPEGTPQTVTEAIYLHCNGLNGPVKDDVRFQYIEDGKIAEPIFWKTNTETNAEMITYTDGLKRDINAGQLPSLRDEKILIYFNELDRANVYKKTGQLFRAQSIIDNAKRELFRYGIPIPRQRPMYTYNVPAPTVGGIDQYPGEPTAQDIFDANENKQIQDKIRAQTEAKGAALGSQRLINNQVSENPPQVSKKDM